MDMILKAEIMLFHMISAFNEACSAATVRESGKVGVCVVGLHLGHHNRPQVQPRPVARGGGRRKRRVVRR